MKKIDKWAAVLKFKRPDGNFDVYAGSVLSRDQLLDIAPGADAANLVFVSCEPFTELVEDDEPDLGDLILAELLAQSMPNGDSQ